MNFASLPDRRADLDPNGPAVSDGTRSLTNAGLLERVRAARRHLHELGVGAGDVVALKLRNRVEFVVLLFACWRLGATVTPVNPSLTDAEVTLQLQASGARLLVVEDGASGPGGVATLAVGNLYAKGPGWDGPPPVDPSALALLIFTSGTTGVPKGVMLDHANLDAMAEMGRQALGIGPADRCLLILPLFHVNGIVVSVLMPLLAGASVVIAERFDAATFFDLIETERPTLLFGGAHHLHHACRAARRSSSRHVVGAVRHLWRRPGLRRIAGPLRGPLRVSVDRGLRTLGGNVRLHHQPGRR